MKRSLLAQGAVLAILSTLHGEEAAMPNEFETLLENASEIATKKLLNVDYLPSVVTVIDTQTYRDAGIQTIAEALDMLPGIQMQTSPMGYTTTTVRGLKMPNAYLSDKIKILIDGVAVNNEVSGSNHFYMDFPMQLVEKIEVLRGPNSTLYGAGAFYGTVNIITKMGNETKENQLFLGTGSYQYRTVGTNFNTSTGNWKLFADGYYKENDKALDTLNSTKQTEEAMKDFSVGLKAINGDFELITRLKKSTYGNFYSFEGDYNPIPERDQDHTNSYFFSQLSYKKSFEDYKLETKASFSHRELDIKANLYSVPEIDEYFKKIGITDMKEGFYTHEKSTEENLEAEEILTLPKIKSNDILIGVGARQAKVTHDKFYSSVENAIMENGGILLSDNPDFEYNYDAEKAFWTDYPSSTLLKKDLSRTITYGYVQDLISLHDQLDLVLGLRADNYSDYGTQWSKRAGLVYRATDTAIFKLLYGSAFRVPTLIEAYQNGHINTRAGDSTIQPEETDTYEAVAIYMPNLNHKLSLNLFYSKLRNIIDLEEINKIEPGYQNFKERDNRGIEFEYFFKTAMEHNLYFNATYLNTQYTIPPEDLPILFVDAKMPDISTLMLKAMYIYRPTETLSLGTTWRYFSETTASEIPWVVESRDSTADQMHIFDETVTYRFSPSNEVRLTIKNLFNEDVRQPSYYYRLPGGVEREGRNWFLNYVYTF